MSTSVGRLREVSVRGFAMCCVVTVHLNIPSVQHVQTYYKLALHRGCSASAAAVLLEATLPPAPLPAGPTRTKAARARERCVAAVLLEATARVEPERDRVVGLHMHQ